MLTFILVLALFGLVAGAIARLLVPGRQPLGCFGTMALGIVGSFIGGFLGWALFGTDLDEGAVQPSGILGAVVGAVLALLVLQAFMGRRDRSPTRRV